MVVASAIDADPAAGQATASAPARASPARRADAHGCRQRAGSTESDVAGHRATHARLRRRRSYLQSWPAALRPCGGATALARRHRHYADAVRHGSAPPAGAAGTAARGGGASGCSGQRLCGRRSLAHDESRSTGRGWPVHGRRRPHRRGARLPATTPRSAIPAAVTPTLLSLRDPATAPRRSPCRDGAHGRRRERRCAPRQPGTPGRQPGPGCRGAWRRPGTDCCRRSR